MKPRPLAASTRWQRRHIARRRAARGGVSLVELLIVISTLTVLMATCTATLYRLMAAQRASTTSLAAALTRSRLGHDFRRDAHAASSAELNGEQLVLTGSVTSDVSANVTTRVTYRRTEAGLLRTESRGDGPELREEYRLPLTNVEFGFEADGGLAVIRLRRSAETRSIAASSRPLPAIPPVEMQIEAVVGIATADVPRDPAGREPSTPLEP